MLAEDLLYKVEKASRVTEEAVLDKDVVSVNDVAESDENWDEEVGWTDLREHECDLYKTLHIPRPTKAGGAIRGGESRVRCNFHRLAVRHHGGSLRKQPWDTVDAFRDRCLKFQQIGLAYAVLKDCERRRIYDMHGWKGLRSSEAYADESVFDLDAWTQFDYFFEGHDEADRQHLLLGGGAHLTSSEEEEDDDEPLVYESIISADEVLQRKDDVPAVPLPRPPSGLGVRVHPEVMRAALGKAADNNIWAEVSKELGHSTSFSQVASDQAPDLKQSIACLNRKCEDGTGVLSDSPKKIVRQTIKAVSLVKGRSRKSDSLPKELRRETKKKRQKKTKKAKSKKLRRAQIQS